MSMSMSRSSVLDCAARPLSNEADLYLLVIHGSQKPQGVWIGLVVKTCAMIFLTILNKIGILLRTALKVASIFPFL